MDLFGNLKKIIYNMISQYDQMGYAQYKPLSIEEIWAPGREMRAQHDKLEEEYATQQALGSVGLNSLNPEKDKVALAAQKKYLDATKAAADELATKGFNNAGRRRQLADLRSMYTNEILPYQEQAKLRAIRDEEYRKASMNRDWIGGRRPSEVSLDEGLRNPNAYDYIGQDAGKMAETLGNKMAPYAQQLMSSGAIKKHKHPYAYQALLSITQGVDPNVIMASMQNNPEALKDPAAKKLYNDMQVMLDQTLQEYNFSEIAPVGTPEYERGRMITARGFSKGIGNVSVQGAKDDWGMKIEMARRAKEEENEVAEKLLLGSPYSVIGEEGASFMGNPMLSKNPLFDKDGSVQLDIPWVKRASDSTVRSSWAIDSFPGYGSTHEANNRKLNSEQRQISQLINQYRKENNIPTSGDGRKTEKEIWDELKFNENWVKDYYSKSGHKIAPINDIVTSNSILNKALTLPSTTWVEFGGDYSKDMDTGIGIEQLAKRHGLKKDQIFNYIQNSGVRAGFNETTGTYSISFPKEMKNIGTSGSPKWVAADDNSKDITVGFSYSNAHQAPVYAINAIRQAVSSNAKEPVKLSKGAEYDRNSGLYTRHVYNPSDGKIYISYTSDSEGNNVKGYIPYIVDANGEQYHLTGADYRAIEIGKIKRNEIIGEEYKGVQEQTKPLPGVKIDG
jgi:hypothetical protein